MAEKKTSTITNVDKSSLDKLKNDIKSNGGTIILYHWNRCGHCLSFMPVWQQLRNMLNDRYRFYDIELETLQKAPAEFGNINSFPTIRMYSTNGKINYDGNRDISSISSFIKENIPKSLSLSKSQEKPLKTPVVKKAVVKKVVKKAAKTPYNDIKKKPLKK